MNQAHDTIRAIFWQDGILHLLDQRKLPQQERYIELRDVTGVAEAIADMVVRGAPAIGITAAYGMVLSARQRFAEYGEDWREHMESDVQLLARSRPTAVNLFWALARMGRVIDAWTGGDPVARLTQEAMDIHREDVEANRRMGELGARLIEKRCGVLTHCNTGSLATGGYGTALGVIRSAYAHGRIKRVYADETRPWLQGSRLTAWELGRDDIPATVVADAAAPYVMSRGWVDWVIVGADRIAANGDVANKIGTYAAAVAARYHGVKVMVVAPSSTVDMSVPSGADIPIETRDAAEVLACGGSAVAPEGAEAWNPVFDITPAGLIDAIVTERGVAREPDPANMAALMGES